MLIACFVEVKLLSTSEAATKLGVAERRVRSMITEGKLAAHKLGGTTPLRNSSSGAFPFTASGADPHARAWRGLVANSRLFEDRFCV